MLETDAGTYSSIYLIFKWFIISGNVIPEEVAVKVK